MRPGRPWEPRRRRERESGEKEKSRNLELVARASAGRNASFGFFNLWTFEAKDVSGAYNYDSKDSRCYGFSTSRPLFVGDPRPPALSLRRTSRAAIPNHQPGSQVTSRGQAPSHKLAERKHRPARRERGFQTLEPGTQPHFMDPKTTQIPQPQSPPASSPEKPSTPNVTRIRRLKPKNVGLVFRFHCRSSSKPTSPAAKKRVGTLSQTESATHPVSDTPKKCRNSVEPV